MRSLSLVGVLALVSGVLAAPPTNLGFEDTAKDDVLPGWFVPPMCANGGWSATVTDKNPAEGTRALELSRSGKGDPGPFGNIMQSFDAQPYQGKRLVITAKARLGEGAAGRVQPWVRVDRPDQKMGFFDNCSDRAITGSDWREIKFVADIHEDALAINIGMMVLGGNGPAYLDAVSLTVKDKPAEVDDPSRLLTERGLANLIAATRYLGYLRHYYPGDEAAALEWDSFITQSLDPIEAAASADELAEVLSRTAALIAPAAQVQTKPFDVAFDPKSMLAPTDKPSHTIAWRHRGFGPGAKREGSIYLSERISTLTGDLQPEPLPEIGDHVARQCRVAPGESVYFRVPIVLYKDAGGTLPRPKMSYSPAEVPQPSGDNRATRLACVVIAWNVLQHHYPYFDVIKSDWDAALTDALRSAATDADAAAFAITLQRLTSRLHDGHGNVGSYSLPATFSLPLVLTFVGDEPVVLNAVGDAVPKGIRPGDVLVSVGGKPIAELIAFAREHEPAASIGFFHHRAATRIVQRPSHDPVTVVLRAPDGQQKEAKIKPITADRLPRERSGPIIAEPRPGIWYIDLDRANDKDLAAAMPSLAKAKGIVLDMRGYPNTFSMGVLGHWSDQPLKCARWEIPLACRPDREDLTFDHSRWDLPPLKPRLTARTAFITDGRAISAAETFMGIVEHYKLAEIVGEPTAGTNGNVSVINLSGGYSVAFTGMKVLKHDGSQHHGIGIIPTIPAHRTITGIAAGKDEMLEKALDVVSSGDKPE